MRTWKQYAGVLALAAWLASGTPASAQHGVILSGGGPIQRSMGGTGTATALDSLGGLFWNPATLSALPHNEMTFGAEVMIPHASVSSSIAANSLGFGVPPISLAGSSHSDSGAMILPNFGWSHHLEDSFLTVGIGLISAAGLSSNYAGSLANPVLSPPPPVGLGLGSVTAELQVFQIVPAVSIQVSDQLSIGVSPIVNIASLRASPFLLAAPNDANGNGFASYPDGTHSHLQWGAGFEIGVYYAAASCWNFGASYKSPQWFETFRFNSTDELGRPLNLSARFDLPAITSLGVSYTGFERWVLTGDVRYIDYRNAQGFGATGFRPDGAVQGLGWQNQIVIALGGQYAVTDRLSLRLGYSYNNNPQSSAVAFFNLAAPTIIEHTLYTGASWKLTDNLIASFAYVHAFESDVEGPIVLPSGALAGTNVHSRVSADAGVVGLTYRY